MADNRALALASMTRAAGVHPFLIRVINRAIATDPCFVLGEGVRSDADQLRDWQRGVSRLNGIPVGVVKNGIAGTGRGNHQTNLADGLGHASDLPPLINGLVWGGADSSDADKWQGCYRTASVMREAAIAESVRLRWGGQWDVPLNDLPAGAVALEAAHNAYMANFHATHGRYPLADGPHFELML
ncbi:MAG: hypothetical protein ISS15_05295 [Alphaproteobacteria bacterium]|nr:hypothetical protein [Alphaproteobacteria bacterium]MBL6939465.1 hypothetical protein [Alphaproteobacteria bacterium]MBL7097054.1 hypothetical protein [Alphaproteobacteria bacterium]